MENMSEGRNNGDTVRKNARYKVGSIQYRISFNIYDLKTNYIWLFYFDTEEAQCRTTGGGRKNAPCIFPFKYKGKSYTKCVWQKDEPQPWCSTKVTKLGFHVGKQDQWGHCNEHCPVPTRPSMTMIGSDLHIYLYIYIQRLIPCDSNQF